MVKNRSGFTLIELLIVMVLIAILATIGVNRFWSVKDRSYVASMKNDLRNMASQQEDYFQKNYNYSPSAALLPDFVPSSGVAITVTHNALDGWSATASHASLAPTSQCAYFTGNAPVQAPATRVGVIDCN
jgi:type IV pilus assembly protein PilA